MSEARKGRKVAAHDVTHEEKYAEVVRLTQTLYALVYVLWV